MARPSSARNNVRSQSYMRKSYYVNNQLDQSEFFLQRKAANFIHSPHLPTHWFHVIETPVIIYYLREMTIPLAEMTGVMLRGHVLIQLVFPVKTLPTELAHWVTSKPSSLLFSTIHFGVTFF